MTAQLDLPERLQIDMAGRPAPHPRELEMEASYLLQRLFPRGVPKDPAGGGAGGGEGEQESEQEKRTNMTMHAIKEVLSKIREGENVDGEEEKPDVAELEVRSALM